MNTIKDAINVLKTELSEIEKEFERVEREIYKAKPHKRFHVGQWVKKGEEVGIVGWIRNENCNISEDDGYFGLDIKTLNRGFRAPCRTDDYEPLNDSELAYFTQTKPVTFIVTGEDIEWLRNRLAYSNSCQSRTKFLKEISK